MPSTVFQGHARDESFLEVRDMCYRGEWKLFSLNKASESTLYSEQQKVLHWEVFHEIVHYRSKHKTELSRMVGVYPP